MNDKTRAEFEEVFPPPPKCWWSEKSNAYCWVGLSVTRHPHDELWQVWLAAKEKYEPSTKQQEAEPVDDGAMFDWIDARARETFSRHKSGARGQQITAADNPESHLIWAALAWARLHPPKPAAQPQVPVEPTEEMIKAGCKQHERQQAGPWYNKVRLSEYDCIAIYKAMLNASKGNGNDN